MLSIKSVDVKYILKNLQFSSVSFIHLQSSGRLEYYKVPYNIEHLKLEKTTWAPTFSLEISVSEKPPGHASCSDSHCLHAGLYHSTFHWIYTPHRATVATLMGIRIDKSWHALCQSLRNPLEWQQQSHASEHNIRSVPLLFVIDFLSL